MKMKIQGPVSPVVAAVVVYRRDPVYQNPLLLLLLYPVYRNQVLWKSQGLWSKSQGLWSKSQVPSYQNQDPWKNQGPLNRNQVSKSQGPDVVAGSGPN
jgi:hypothetical protein